VISDIFQGSATLSAVMSVWRLHDQSQFAIDHVAMGVWDASIPGGNCRRSRNRSAGLTAPFYIAVWILCVMFVGRVVRSSSDGLARLQEIEQMGFLHHGGREPNR
jgi:hypothetical protein